MEDTLLAAVGSAVAELTFAVLVSVPTTVGLKTMFFVEAAPLFKVLMLQMTTPFESEQPELAETKVAFAGTGLLSTIDAAAEGPRLETVTL